MNFLEKIEQHKKTGQLPDSIANLLCEFYFSYCIAAQANRIELDQIEPILIQFQDFVVQNLENPYAFEPFHKRILKPFNYYRFGIEFIRPLVQLESSTVRNLHYLTQIEKQLADGDNVILLANHQTEPDPQAISLLLEKTHPKLAEEMIFVAGHRVISDPMAIPFSMGRNLLCIYSKKHVELIPELKSERLAHNQRTMIQMSQLLAEGGKCIYVAPSGGRDRRDQQGQIIVASFDPQSIEMFWLMAQRSGHPTHFYPLALSTYKLLPPPDSVDKELGEQRLAQATPIHLAFASEIDMHISNTDNNTLDKKELRKIRADYIWQQVYNEYQFIK